MGDSPKKSGPLEKAGEDRDEREIEPARGGQLEKAGSSFFPFFNFRFSYRSMTTGSDGKAHIKAAEHRFENGKLESEEFEGTADLKTYFEYLDKLQQRVFDQFASFLRPFLPPPPEDKE